MRLDAHIERLLMGIFLAHYGLYVLHSTLCQQKAIPPQSNENSHNIMWSTSSYGPNPSTLQFMRRVLREGGHWAILETDSELSLQTIINIVW